MKRSSKKVKLLLEIYLSRGTFSNIASLICSNFVSLYVAISAPLYCSSGIARGVQRIKICREPHHSVQLTLICKTIFKRIVSPSKIRSCFLIWCSNIITFPHPRTTEEDKGHFFNPLAVMPMVCPQVVKGVCILTPWLRKCTRCTILVRNLGEQGAQSYKNPAKWLERLRKNSWPKPTGGFTNRGTSWFEAQLLHLRAYFLQAAIK